RTLLATSTTWTTSIRRRSSPCTGHGTPISRPDPSIRGCSPSQATSSPATCAATDAAPRASCWSRFRLSCPSSIRRTVRPTSPRRGSACRRRSGRRSSCCRWTGSRSPRPPPGRHHRERAQGAGAPRLQAPARTRAPMTTPPVHDALVRRLVADAAPVRPLRSVGVRMLPWLAVAALDLAIAVTFGLRASPAAALGRPLLVAAGITAAAIALRAAVPGGEAGRGTQAAALALGAAAVVLMLLEPAGTAVPSARFVAEGTRCTLCTLVLLAALRRGAPLDGTTAGAWAGGAAFLIAAAAVRLGCPIDERLHLAAWHLLAALGGTIVTALAAAPALERWQRPVARRDQ